MVIGGAGSVPTAMAEPVLLSRRRRFHRSPAVWMLRARAPTETCRAPIHLPITMIRPASATRPTPSPSSPIGLEPQDPGNPRRSPHRSGPQPDQRRTSWSPRFVVWVAALRLPKTAKTGSTRGSALASRSMTAHSRTQIPQRRRPLVGHPLILSPAGERGAQLGAGKTNRRRAGPATWPSTRGKGNTSRLLAKPIP